MEKLAKASLSKIPSIPIGAMIHDDGCGTGAGTVAIVDTISNAKSDFSVKATDINRQALEIYTVHAADKSWPA